MPEGTKRLILETTVHIFGRAELIRALQATEDEFEMWLAGIKPLPDDKLLKIADLLADRADKKK